MRLFIAVALPEDLKERIGLAVGPLTSLPGSWTRPKSYHLTIVFLGEQPEESVGQVESAMRSAAGAMSHLEAALGPGGFFPDSRRPRVGWIGVDSGGRLEAVAESVRASVSSAGFIFDSGRFSPHLTLVRLRGRWHAEEVQRFEAAARTLSGERFPIDRIELFSSELRPGGAVHRVIGSTILA